MERLAEELKKITSQLPKISERLEEGEETGVIQPKTLTPLVPYEHTTVLETKEEAEKMHGLLKSATENTMTEEQKQQWNTEGAIAEIINDLEKLMGEL